MEKYHPFVFDLNKRKFVGKFEEMYLAETTAGFDSWHQEDNRQIARSICLLIYNSYNFNRILDVGCGKGSFTHLLKRNNNIVLGIDISKTALNIAKERYPDIVFEELDLTKNDETQMFFEKQDNFDLILCSETLSYLNKWKRILKIFSKSSAYCMINLFIPDNPIGFVKTETGLAKEFQKHFDLLHHITIHNEKKTILFGKSFSFK